MPSMVDLRSFFEYFILRSYTNEEIVEFMRQHLNIHRSIRTLKRWLHAMRLGRHDPRITPLEIQRAISIERQGPRRNLGNSYLYYALRSRHGLRISWRQVTDMALLLNPMASQRNRRQTWARRIFFAPGPNYRWCLDGYDKLKTYGIYIHGCIDEFSRKLLWLNAYTTNRQPLIVLSYFLKALKQFGVRPVFTVSDMGWEAIHIAESQIILNMDDSDSRIHHHWGYSTQNVTIEAYWRQLRHRSIQFWIEKFDHLKTAGYYSDCELDKLCLWFVYMPLILIDLKGVVEYSDTHNIRSQPRTVRPHGRPVVLFNFPERYGFENQGQQIGNQEIDGIARLYGLQSLDLPDYLPMQFRIDAETWCLQNNIDVQLGTNDEQAYIDLREYFITRLH